MASLAPARSDLTERGAALGISIVPLTPTIGAEIAGLDLGRTLSRDEEEWLHDAWLTHKVVFFRDNDLSYEQHLRVARLFGELEGHPVIPHVEGHPELLRINGIEGRTITADTYAPLKAFNK